MSREVQLILPLPLGPDQVQLLRQLCSAVAVCSEGTDRYEAFEILREFGLVSAAHCPSAGDVWQFSITFSGRDWLSSNLDLDCG